MELYLAFFAGKIFPIFYFELIIAFVCTVVLSNSTADKVSFRNTFDVSVDTAQPGWDEPTAMQQTAGSMGTLARHNSVIPRVAFLLSQALIKRDIEVR